MSLNAIWGYNKEGDEMSEFMGINIYDLVVVALILLLSIKGLISGFTKELFSAIGLIGGLYTATYFNDKVASYIHSNISADISVPLLTVIATVVIFIGVWYIASLIGKGFFLIGDGEFISITSRLAGMLIKMVALFFIFALITFALSKKPQVAQKFKDTLDSSKLYPLLKNTGAAILNFSTNSITSLTEVNASKESNSSVKVENNNSEMSKKIDSNSTK